MDTKIFWNTHQKAKLNATHLPSPLMTPFSHYFRLALKIWIALAHFWISESTHRHERTDWRLGMEDWHEKANQNQRERLPRKDGGSASDYGRSAVHPPSTPPNRLWYLPYLGIRSPLVAATASMSGCPVTASIFDGTAWSLLLTDRLGRVTLVHLNARSSERWRGATNLFFVW